jgi:NAD(P)-dependent dehydrogenase (short-subunit alcohol dehydrogenase family)
MTKRVAIVTGGTKGIGGAVTERLSAEGAHVCAVYAGDHDTARALQRKLADDGQSISVHSGDIGDRAFCRDLVAAIEGEHGSVDYLVNNAGLLVENNAFRLTEDEWDRAIRVNLSGPFHLAQAVLPSMAERGFGRIVNVGSVTAAMGSPVEVAYGAAKSGLVGMTRSLARAVARKGVTVNLVIPGVFDTDMTRSMRQEAQDAIAAMIPLGRRGLPAELAHAVLFLLDDRASYVTGSVVTVDGGLSMGG